MTSQPYIEVVPSHEEAEHATDEIVLYLAADEPEAEQIIRLKHYQALALVRDILTEISMVAFYAEISPERVIVK